MMKKIIFLLMIVFLLPFVSAVETMQGYVIDTDTNAINDTLVELFNQSFDMLNSTNTDETGFYNMTYDITSSGVYILNFSKLYYVNTTVNKVIIDNEGIYEVNITLQKENMLLGAINGTVSDISGALEGAEILIKIGDSVIDSTATDSAGVYNINPILSGNYNVSVSYTKCMGQTKNATVMEGNTTTIDFVELGNCTDGIQNQGEEGIDCGSPCSAACPTCSDGIQNQGEDKIDCGGPCDACPDDTQHFVPGGGGGGGGGGACIPEWECDDWSECTSAGKQTKTCTDKRSCSSYYHYMNPKPEEEQDCTYTPGEGEDEQEEGEEGEEGATTGGIIGITGRAIGDLAEFGKSNFAFILILIAVIALFIVISAKMAKEEEKKARIRRQQISKGKGIKFKNTKGYKEMLSKKIGKAKGNNNVLHITSSLASRFSNRVKRAHKAAKKVSIKQKKEAKKKLKGKKTKPLHKAVIHHVKKLVSPKKQIKKKAKKKAKPKLIKRTTIKKIYKRKKR